MRNKRAKRMAWSKERLKHFRKDVCELNQTEFAAYVGVSMLTISNWERGRTIPEVAQKLLDRLEREKKDELAGQLQSA